MIQDTKSVTRDGNIQFIADFHPYKSNKQNRKKLAVADNLPPGTCIHVDRADHWCRISFVSRVVAAILFLGHRIKTMNGQGVNNESDQLIPKDLL